VPILMHSQIGDDWQGVSGRERANVPHNTWEVAVMPKIFQKILIANRVLSSGRTTTVQSIGTWYVVWVQGVQALLGYQDEHLSPKMCLLQYLTHQFFVCAGVVLHENRSNPRLIPSKRSGSPRAKSLPDVYRTAPRLRVLLRFTQPTARCQSEYS
jgi:hypothetical protein